MVFKVSISIISPRCSNTVANSLVKEFKVRQGCQFQVLQHYQVIYIYLIMGIRYANLFLYNLEFCCLTLFVTQWQTRQQWLTTLQRFSGQLRFNTYFIILMMGFFPAGRYTQMLHFILRDIFFLKPFYLVGIVKIEFKLISDNKRDLYLKVILVYEACRKLATKIMNRSPYESKN